MDAGVQPDHDVGLSFRVIPLKDAKGFTNREIPDFLNEERGLQMKKLWENVNAVEGISDLVRATAREIPSQTAYQYFSEPNRGHTVLDQVPEVLQKLLGLSDEVDCEFDLFKHKSAGFNGVLVFKSIQKEGDATVTKEVEVELKINRPYRVSYREHAVIGPYEAERTTKIDRADMNDYQQYWISDNRLISYPSGSEVDVWVTGSGDEKWISDEDMSSQGWTHENRPGRRKLGVNFNGPEPTYFDVLVPTVSITEKRSGVPVIKTYDPDENYFGKLFPKDETLY